MKVSLTFSELSDAEARHLLAQAGGQTGSTTPPLPGTPQVPVTPATAVPPSTTLPPPAASAAPADATAAVQAAMEKYVGKYGAQAALNVMSQVNATRIRDVTDPAVLKWLTDTFNAG